MLALLKHPKMKVFLGISTLLGITLIVMQAIGMFTRFDLIFAGEYGAMQTNLFVDTGIILYFSLFPGIWIVFAGREKGGFLIVLFWIGYITAAMLVGRPSQILFPFTAAGVATALSVVQVLDCRRSFLEREKDDVNRLFGNFLTDRTLNYLLRHQELLQPAGTSKTLSVLFADIRGFTAIADTLPPAQIIRMLRLYFRYMIPIIRKHGGTVNKLIGDGILAVFGDPIPQENHAERAALAALEMQRAMEVMAQDWATHGLQHASIGIGINTGTIVLGDIGPEGYHTYSVLGRAVNLVSQLEATCPDGGIQVSHAVYTLLQNQFVFDPLGEQSYKHFQEPVPIYRLVNRKI
jgi:class 3 adenylate cyclase